MCYALRAPPHKNPRCHLKSQLQASLVTPKASVEASAQSTGLMLMVGGEQRANEAGSSQGAFRKVPSPSEPMKSHKQLNSHRRRGSELHNASYLPAPTRMLSIKNSGFALRRELRTAGISKTLSQKASCKLVPLNFNTGFQPKKVTSRGCLEPGPCRSLCWSCTAYVKGKLHEKATAKHLTHSHAGISKPGMGSNRFLLKLLVHLRLCTSPNSITN